MGQTPDGNESGGGGGRARDDTAPAGTELSGGDDPQDGDELGPKVLPTYILSFWCCRFPMAATNPRRHQQTMRLGRLRFLDYFREFGSPGPGSWNKAFWELWFPGAQSACWARPPCEAEPCWLSRVRFSCLPPNCVSTSQRRLWALPGYCPAHAVPARSAQTCPPLYQSLSPSLLDQRLRRCPPHSLRTSFSLLSFGP